MTETLGRMGADTLADGTTRFRVWAPSARELGLCIVGTETRTVTMNRRPGDVFEVCLPDAGAGTDYFYIIDGTKERPDPCSRFQPRGVHGPSRVVSSDSFTWSDQSWTGIPLSDLIFYELHVGTFTPEGTFEGVVGKLDYLKNLGVTAIELMPVAQFPGERNWGYDGVFPYAPHASYGGPDGLRRLVDECHRRGLALALDVVYNHLGPEGNYLADYGSYFTDRYTTPWGRAINFDGPDSDEVRSFFRENALYWLADFHVDVLRFDAIHSIFDMSARHFLQETSSAFHQCAEALGRRAFVIAESDLNDVRVIQTAERNGLGFDAQWGDDFHHALMAALTGARHGYFADFGAMADVAKAMSEGFVYDGKRSQHRKRRHGSSSANEAGHRLVPFVQNHDQVANAWHGKRLAKIVSAEQQKIAAALLFAHPGLPMLFMGEEFAEIAPFDFFTSHSDPALIEAVRSGRREEHRSMGLEDPPDPQAQATFAACKLGWSRLSEDAQRETLHLYRDLIALRKGSVAVSNGRKDLATVQWSEAPRWITVERRDERGGAVAFVVNFEAVPRAIPLRLAEGYFRLAIDTGDRRYGGRPGSDPAQAALEVVGETPKLVHCPGQRALIYVKIDSPS
ncbi:MAG TPA: malto-oligosyltrehalose trehalohydrolase [Polyangiaceae bacterium]